MKSVFLDYDGVKDISFAEIRVLLKRFHAGERISIINAGPEVAAKFEETGVSSFIDVTRKPAPLDISRYSEFGAGYLSKAYNSVDGDSMLKMYGANVPAEVALREKNVARAVLRFGINTPMVGSLYEYGGDKCIEFERIEGKRSFSRIISEEPDKLEELGVRFSKMCLELHSTPCDTTIFNDRASFYRQVVSSSDAIDDAGKAKVIAFIDSVPPETTCLHGDMQPSNVITNGTEDFWIDLSDFGYGNHMFDLGMWYFLSILNEEKLMQHIFHLSKEQMFRLWNIFVREYFGAVTPDDVEDVRHKVEPFAALHMLYLGTVYGFEPGMVDYVKKIFSI